CSVCWKVTARYGLHNRRTSLRWERRASINFTGTGSIEVFHPPFSMSTRQSLAEEGMQHHRSHLRQSPPPTLSDPLVSLIIKASAYRAGDPRFESCRRAKFSNLISFSLNLCLISCHLIFAIQLFVLGELLQEDVRNFLLRKINEYSMYHLN
ncbi:unnamed protein product, partial [Nesidiocoris tenuis]